MASAMTGARVWAEPEVDARRFSLAASLVRFAPHLLALVFPLEFVGFRAQWAASVVVGVGVSGADLCLRGDRWA